MVDHEFVLERKHQSNGCLSDKNSEKVQKTEAVRGYIKAQEENDTFRKVVP